MLILVWQLNEGSRSKRELKHVSDATPSDIRRLLRGGSGVLRDLCLTLEALGRNRHGARSRVLRKRITLRLGLQPSLPKVNMIHADGSPISLLRITRKRKKKMFAGGGVESPSSGTLQASGT